LKKAREGTGVDEKAGTGWTVLAKKKSKKKWHPKGAKKTVQKGGACGLDECESEKRRNRECQAILKKIKGRMQ